MRSEGYLRRQLIDDPEIAYAMTSSLYDGPDD
jgi:hypothetical protein